AELGVTVKLHPVSSSGLIAWQLSASKEHRMASSPAEQRPQDLHLGGQGNSARCPCPSASLSRIPRIHARPGLSRLRGYRSSFAFAADQRTLVGARLRAVLPAREREPDDRALDHPKLLVERPRVVRKPVALADLAHLRGDLPVTRARHVREQVVLDLVA